jgi:post-segregation antitoxin (ccd killing protein)
VIASARRWRLPEEAIATLEGFAGETGAARVRPRFATPFDR